MTRVILGVEHRGVTRKYELPVDVRHDGNYGRGDRDASCDQSKVIANWAHRAAMVTKSDWKQKTPATHIPVQVDPQRSQIRNWSRYHVVIRRIVTSDGDGRKFLRRCQDSANRIG